MDGNNKRYVWKSRSAASAAPASKETPPPQKHEPETGVVKAAKDGFTEGRERAKAAHEDKRAERANKGEVKEYRHKKQHHRRWNIGTLLIGILIGIAIGILLYTFWPTYAQFTNSAAEFLRNIVNGIGHFVGILTGHSA